MAQMISELIDVRNTDGSLTGEVKERREIHRDGDLHGTAHVWLVRYRPDRQSADVLLQKRSSGKDSFPGCYDISSAGHIPSGDGFRESALRELWEELGVCAKPEDLVCEYTHIGYKEAEFYGQIFKNHEYSRVYLYECDLEAEEFRLQPEEVESVLWMDFLECLECIRENTIEHCIFTDEYEELTEKIREYFAGTGRPLAPRGQAHTLTETWAEDAQAELEDWIEEQGIYIRQ